MAFYTGEVICEWDTSTGSNQCLAALRYSGGCSEFQDSTEQNDANIPPDPNLVLWKFKFLTPAQLDALENDSDIKVLWSRNMDSQEEEQRPFNERGSTPTQSAGRVRDPSTQPTAQDRAALSTFLQTKGMRPQDVSAIVRAGISRDQMKEELREHARTRPKRPPQAGGQGELRER